MSTVADTPIAHTDATNAKILAISEDRIQGFVRDPIGEIAERSGVDVDTVVERIRAMLRAGVMQDGAIHREEAGAPQGGVISPCLCNVYLHRLDRQWTGARDRRSGALRG